MKRIFFILTIVIIFLPVTKAADLLVEEFGFLPSYSTITDAVAAASDGDRIIIKNKIGNVPWVENITVGKSLEFVPYTNDSFFIVTGNYFIQPADNRVVTFIGMKNNNGDIYVNTNANTAARTQVNIFGCHLVNGFLGFGYSGYDVNVVGNRLDDGYILFKYGNVIGNQVTSAANAGVISCSNDGQADNKVNLIYGNRVTSNNINIGYPAIKSSNTTQFIDIRNNFVITKNTGINVTATKNSSLETTTIYNNTVSFIDGSGSSSIFRHGILIDGIGSSSELEVYGNLIDMNTSVSAPNYVGINIGSGTAPRFLNYNMIDADAQLDTKINGSWSSTVGNTTNVTVTVNSTDGTTNQGIDLGHPAPMYSDTDLSRNDCGVYGGSFTQSNYYPLFTGSARVWHVSYPFNVRSGNTIDVAAPTYDR